MPACMYTVDIVQKILIQLETSPETVSGRTHSFISFLSNFKAFFGCWVVDTCFNKHETTKRSDETDSFPKNL